MREHNQGYAKDIDITSVLTDLKVDNKSQLLQLLAKEATKYTGGSSQYLNTALEKQEQFHNSALGEYVATPNLKLKNIRKPVTILAKLDQGIHYDAADGQLVDIACLILSPEQEGPVHLRRLARLSRHLKNPELRAKIKETSDKETIKTLIMNPDGWMLAA